MSIFNDNYKEQVSLSESESILVEKVLDSYKMGCAKLINTTPEIIGEQLNKKLGEKLFERMKISLSNREISLLNQAVKVRYQSLNAARSSDLITADKLMEEARIIGSYRQLSPEGNLLYKAFQEPAEAYLDYRRGDFDKAWLRISDALATDALLETECGYKCLFAHRLHLIEILIRSEAKSTRKWRAMELAGQLLSYLQGTSESLPFPIAWGSELVANQPLEIISATFALVTGQIAIILAEEKCHQGRDLFAILDSYLTLQVDNTLHPCSQALNWLRIKRAFLNNDMTDFLELASQFLVVGRDSTPVLWYATVVDTLELLRQTNFQNYHLVKQEIAKNAVNWEFFPKQFLLVLNS
ncbi:MAG: hypothetical protein KME64_22905 [Scytonematopsis contorta HA4267-MV1]|jgi:hypothetical protein|nr:hypothetical protein [Scytonematopsis contorta HA4267-MV1]